MPLKEHLKNGKGEFSYLKDWMGDDEDSSAPDRKSMKGMLLAMIDEEIESRVSEKMKHHGADVLAKLSAMEESMKAMKSERTSHMDGLMTAIAGLVKDIGAVRAASAAAPVHHKPQPMQAHAPMRPVAYSAEIVRSSDGLLKAINLVPKG